MAIHTVIMAALGMNIFDNLDLEAASQTAAKLNQWEFMLVATPTPSPHGTGARISPVAIF